jgi:hypothetical protein
VSVDIGEELNKTRFVSELRRYVRVTDRLARGMVPLLLAIANYFEDHTEIPEDQLGINWCRDLGDHLVDAFEEFRKDPKHAVLRSQYREIRGYDIPSLVDIRGSFEYGFVSRDIARVMGDVTAQMYGGDWLKAELEGRFGAQSHAIEEAWRTFVRKCYRTGLYDQIKAESHRGNSGEFGSTTLMTYVMAGRIMFTFNRDDRGVSFVADESDASGCRSGINYPTDGLPYTKLVEMIEEVVANWDIDKLKPSKTVGLG